MTRIVFLALCLPVLAFAQVDMSPTANNCESTVNGICQEPVVPRLNIPTAQIPVAPSFQITELQVSNTQHMAALLKSVGLCSVAQLNYGQVSCDHLVSHTRFMVHPSSDGSATGRLSIILEPVFQVHGNLIIGFARGSQLDMSFFPINGQAGLEGRGYTHIGNAQLVTLQIQNGNLAKGSVEVRLANNLIAVGQIAQCELVNCGL